MEQVREPPAEMKADILKNEEICTVFRWLSFFVFIGVKKYFLLFVLQR